MNPMDASKTSFMLNHDKYYYNVMSFDLKNVGATYQRLTDALFPHQIGRNVEVYVNDMIVKTTYGHSHVDDLEDILQSVRRHDMSLNPAKCSFGVHAGKFLDFILTRRGIEANPNKFQTLIDVRSPTNVKEMQQLTGHLIALSRFLSYVGDKTFLFFVVLIKKKNFE